MEDEDLVDEGSALYLHLKETGFSDFEAKAIHEENEQRREVPVPSSGGLMKSFSYWRNKLRSFSNEQRWKDVHRVVEILLDSRVLLPADCELIKEWLQPQESSHFRTDVWLLALSAGTFLLPLRSIVSLKNTIVCNVAVVSAVKGCQLRSARRLRRTAERYVQAAEELLHLLNKSIRLLHEKIVVARGFTFAVGGSWGQEEEENSSGWYYCSSLRSEVLTAERSVLEAYHSALSKLLISHPLPSHLDHSEQYVTLHSQEQLLSEQPQNLVKLKQGVGVVCAVQSEVVRRLILCFVPELSSRVPPPKVMEDVLSELTCRLDSITKQLGVVYRYSRAPSNASHRKEETQSPDHVLYLPIRSLSLHLEAALAKLHSLEDSISKKEVNHQVLEDSLKRCKLDLDACCICYDDALQSLKLKPEEEPCPKVEVPTQMPSAQPPNVIPYQPYVAQDEVLEATVDEHTGDQMDMDFDFPGPLDREKRKMEKEYVKKVFGELKSVLVEKAAEWKKREDIAVARLKQERGEDEGNSNKGEEGIIDNDECRRDESGLKSIPGTCKGESDHLEQNVPDAFDSKVPETEGLKGGKELNIDASSFKGQTGPNQNNISEQVYGNISQVLGQSGTIIDTSDSHNSTNIIPSTLGVNTDTHLPKESSLIIAETNASAESDEKEGMVPTRRRRSLPRRTRPPQRKALVKMTSAENTMLSPRSEPEAKPCLPSRSLSSILAREAVAKSAMFKVRRGEEESFGGDSDSD